MHWELEFDFLCSCYASLAWARSVVVGAFQTLTTLLVMQKRMGGGESAGLNVHAVLEGSCMKEFERASHCWCVERV